MHLVSTRIFPKKFPKIFLTPNTHTYQEVIRETSEKKIESRIYATY